MEGCEAHDPAHQHGLRGRCSRLPVLLLCSVYGMRATEIMQLRLDDIDWRNETITIRRAERGRVQQFPRLFACARLDSPAVLGSSSAHDLAAWPLAALARPSHRAVEPALTAAQLISLPKSSSTRQPCRSGCAGSRLPAHSGSEARQLVAMKSPRSQAWVGCRRQACPISVQLARAAQARAA